MSTPTRTTTDRVEYRLQIAEISGVFRLQVT